MKYKQFQSNELQRLRLRFPKLSSLAKYFEEPDEKVIKWLKKDTIPPVKFVRSLEAPALHTMIFKHGFKALSKRWSVSVPFLKKVAQEKQDINSLNIESVSPDLVKQIAERVEFTKIFHALTDKKLKDYRDDINTGDSSLTDFKGRLGEAFYSSIRGVYIIEDMNASDLTAPYDFRDAVWGAVNVKASKTHRIKSLDRDYQRYWKFSTNGSQDHIACIGFDVQFIEPLFIIMTQPVEDVKSFTLTASDVRRWKKKYPHCVLYIGGSFETF